MNELEKLLNEVPSGKAALDSGLSEEMKAPVSDKSPTALVVDQWGHGQARKLGKDERNKDTEHSETLILPASTPTLNWLRTLKTLKSLSGSASYLKLLVSQSSLG